MMESTLRKRAQKTEEELVQLMIRRRRQIPNIGRYETPEFANPETIRSQKFSPTDVGYIWHRNREWSPDDRLNVAAEPNDVAELDSQLSLGTNVWFRLQFRVPENMAGQPIYLKFIAQPHVKHGRDSQQPVFRTEAICYRNGEPWQAFDGGHDDLLLTEEATEGEQYDLLVEVGTTALSGGLDVDTFQLEAAYIYSTRPVVATLYRNVHILHELAKDIPESSPNYGRILRAIFDASKIFPFQTNDETKLTQGAEEALSILNECKSSLTSDLSDFTLTTIGHAHLDVAWKWPWSETVRKCARSFSNTLKVMEEYPEFQFMQSQPQLYEFTRQHYPELFDRILDQIDDNQWVPEGAMWVEADVNITGAESIARQYLYGKRYFRDEFDVDPQITFLPDVFGYSPGLPGIAQEAGCPYFLTQKLSWNETNTFPYNTFEWEGIDGSSILTHFPPVNTYNGRMDVDEVREAVTGFSENDVLNESVYLIGWGDGGGGVTREMIEKSRVIDEVNSLPDIEFDTVEGFFKRLEKNSSDLPTWRGELYLEKHRGTLTTQAKTKRNNRRGEFALREAEIWAALATTAGQDDSYQYPSDEFERAWRLLMFNQFHDILPGSSITEVYRDADREYDRLFDIVTRLTDEALNAMFDRSIEDDAPYLCVTNSLSWDRDPIVEVDLTNHPLDNKGEFRGEDSVAATLVTSDGGRLPVQGGGDDLDQFVFKAEGVPSFGAASYKFESAPSSPSFNNPFDVSTNHLENKHVRVELDGKGRIESVFDKDAARETLSSPGNRFMLYRDLPADFDAWDIEEDVYEVGETFPNPESVEVIETGPVRAIVRQTWKFGNESKLIQDVTLYQGERRVNFRTYVDWNEDETLLKVHFPLAIHAESATYETHFGHHESYTNENTSWDQARFEEPHQKWVDVSEPGFGAAVLNDCKYGVHVDGSDVSLSLLRAPKDPDPEADQGSHTFTYSLLPHEGSLQEAGVIREAYEINAPTEVLSVGTPTNGASLSVSDPSVVVEAVKVAEDSSNRLVVRLYESWGRPTTTQLTTGFPLVDAAEMTLIEDECESLSVGDGSRLSLEFDAFEIKTVALDPASSE